MSQKFFALYQTGNTDKALDYLFAQSTNMPMPLGVDMKMQLKRQVEVSGRYFGVENLAVRTAGPNVMMYTYLVKHQVQPLVFRIMYYRANDIWQMHTFTFHNNLFEELEESSKAKRLKENRDLGL